MLEGHLLRSLLSQDIKTTLFFSLHEIFHGITAPGFLFGAGFTFTIATQRRWEQVTAYTRAFFRRVWRAVLLILIGYALHFPFLSLQKTIETATFAQLNSFFLFDVLQCIGISILLMRLLLVLTRRELPFLITLVVLLLAIVYTTPILWSNRIHQSLPLFFSTALNGLSGSPFPLFPYAGFLLAGACVSWVFLRATQSRHEEIFIKRLLLIGILLAAIGTLLDVLPTQTYREYSFWNTSPNYFWIRLGVLFVMLAGLWFVEDFYAIKRGSLAWMPKWVILLGVESLFVYVFHLLIIYGWVSNPEFNLHWLWGNNLNIIESMTVFFALTLVIVPFSFAWRYIKKRHPILMNILIWWIGLCMTWSFLFNPY